MASQQVVDGWCEDGYIATAKITHVAMGGEPMQLRVPLEFSYRPAAASESAVHIARLGNIKTGNNEADEAKAIEVNAKFIVEKVARWNVSSEVTVAAASRLSLPLMNKLVNVIRGMAPADEGGIDLGDEQGNS